MNRISWFLVVLLISANITLVTSCNTAGGDNEIILKNSPVVISDSELLGYLSFMPKALLRTSDSNSLILNTYNHGIVKTNNFEFVALLEISDLHKEKIRNIYLNDIKYIGDGKILGVEFISNYLAGGLITEGEDYFYTVVYLPIRFNLSSGFFNENEILLIAFNRNLEIKKYWIVSALLDFMKNSVPEYFASTFDEKGKVLYTSSVIKFAGGDGTAIKSAPKIFRFICNDQVCELDTMIYNIEIDKRIVDVSVKNSMGIKPTKIVPKMIDSKLFISNGNTIYLCEDGLNCDIFIPDPLSIVGHFILDFWVEEDNLLIHSIRNVKNGVGNEFLLSLFSIGDNRLLSRLSLMPSIGHSRQGVFTVLQFDSTQRTIGTYNIAR